MIRASTWALAVAFCFACTAAAQTVSEETPGPSDEEAVKAAVTHFLTAIGNHDLDALPPMFTDNANIGSVRFREGQWVTKTYTFEEFYSRLKAQENPARYQEPVSHFTVHVENGGLAFVRAKATLIRDNQARLNNIDYFTLMKVGEEWRFLSASYVATRVAK